MRLALTSFDVTMCEVTGFLRPQNFISRTCKFIQALTDSNGQLWKNGDDTKREDV